MEMLLREIEQTQVKADYQKTLALLRALKAGQVSLDQVTLTENGWNLVQVTVEEAAPPPPKLADVI